MNTLHLENDDCDQCLDESTLHNLYCEFISETLIPRLDELCEKYSVWWTFKPDSLLKEYFEKHNIYIDSFFYPQQLIDAILNHAECKFMFIPGNQKLIYLNNELQNCFNCSFLFIEDLLVKCLPHVYALNKNDMLQLKHKAIHNNIFIEAPETIIYNDPSSCFWLNPDISFICNFQNIIWTWNELYNKFYDYCTTNKEHFTCVDESFIFINENSALSEIFDFKYFHRDQIETILKNITRYLGKSQSVGNYLHFKNNIRPNVIKFIDYIVNNNSNLNPYIKNNINLN